MSNKRTKFPKLGIIAGGGDLPKALIHELLPSREIFVVALEGETDFATCLNVPHEWVNMAAIGKTVKALQNAGIEEVVLAGGVNRPAFSSLKPDFEGIKLLSSVVKLRNQGDNAVLSAIIKYLEKCGFKVVGSHELLAHLVIEKGHLGKFKPSKQDIQDITLAREVLKKTGGLDIGQGVITQAGRVIGIEAAEGTDNLVKRCGDYLKKENGGVLVKMKKPGQDARADLPSIGVRTVENAAASGLVGIALEVGSTLIIDKPEVKKRADQLGIFITGIESV